MAIGVQEIVIIYMLDEIHLKFLVSFEALELFASHQSSLRGAARFLGD